jgi:hypothetical protein
MTTPPRLLGTYQTPTFTYGDVVCCARRGDVHVVGLSDAPIPWPIGQTMPSGRARALVLSGDLVEAVRRESAEAVMPFWGVKANTVWTWRKALGVAEDNEGTTALKSELLSPVLEKARANRPQPRQPRTPGQDQRGEEEQAAPAARHRGDAEGSRGQAAQRRDARADEQEPPRARDAGARHETLDGSGGRVGQGIAAE